MNKVYVVGIGLDGIAGLSKNTKTLINKATLLVGSDRHLSYFPYHPASRLFLSNFTQAIEEIRHHLITSSETVVVLVSGDPLFFGLGRFLLSEFSSERLEFYPHQSSVQLAFNRIKVPWQDARIISIHGRSLDVLIKALQQGQDKIAVLTDGTNNPQVIARLLQDLHITSQYQFWVCENLGGEDERVRCFSPREIERRENSAFAALNVVVLIRQQQQEGLNLDSLPQFGIADNLFLSFSDRPGLMTKREVRTLVLAELSLCPGQVIWDIGAGTGSVAVEIARLCPSSQVYAIEKTAAGHSLISRNCERFQVKNIIPVLGSAPDMLHSLPENCDRVFIGGSGGNLTAILHTCSQRLNSQGIVVIALATMEHINTALSWFQSHDWHYQILQVQLSRSVAVGNLTRLSPLNPVTIITAINV
ncbi:precorrin-6y C5,15-methyltransferase (decarboxylating) subunit CbiE [Calothrix rhizosoleniae]|uniref:precorrin-6y C5,15-methyltransferase (decarboxylating) subunit CbiE n=1 Tax=Calothrix rhizosoleniae TaxID=888997 RepID=UPI000B49FD7C|nr:precorrin-6y C5,15-methyltransferase (decarboxylating) subunit CbiE [Calothrix rhizosoleniae]